jgi:hypothetical protein
MMIVIVERWEVVDRWWLPEEEIRIKYAEVDWDGRKIIFRKEKSDTTWRIFKPEE